MSKLFQLTKDVYATARWENTSSGFRHVATLFRKGQEIGSAKATYYNRTWESYEFQSVLEKLVEYNESLTKREKTLAMKKINSGKF